MNNNVSAEDKIYGSSILLTRLKSRFDGKENSLIELPKHLQNKRNFRISKAFLYNSFCLVFKA